MLTTDVYNDFLVNYDNKNLKGSTISLVKEMGNIIVNDRENFIDLLLESEIPANSSMSDSELVNLYIDNMPNNNSLQVGSSMLIGYANETTGFDGAKELNDPAIKAAYHVFSIYFYDPSANTDYSNAIGGGIGEAIKGITGLGKSIVDSQKAKKSGAMDMATKKADAKAAMTQQILEQRKIQLVNANAKKQASAKNTKIALIVGGSLVGLAIIGLVIYKVVKNKK